MFLCPAQPTVSGRNPAEPAQPRCCSVPRQPPSTRAAPRLQPQPHAAGGKSPSTAGAMEHMGTSQAKSAMQGGREPLQTTSIFDNHTKGLRTKVKQLQLRGQECFECTLVQQLLHAGRDRGAHVPSPAHSLDAAPAAGHCQGTHREMDSKASHLRGKKLNGS